MVIAKSGGMEWIIKSKMGILFLAEIEVSGSAGTEAPHHFKMKET